MTATKHPVIDIWLPQKTYTHATRVNVIVGGHKTDNSTPFIYVLYADNIVSLRLSFIINTLGSLSKKPIDHSFVHHENDDSERERERKYFLLKTNDII